MVSSRARWLPPILAVLALTSPSIVLPPAAVAATATRSDARGDAPTRIDIVSGTYRNGPRYVSGSVRVVALGQSGRARLAVSPPTDGDDYYVARVHRLRDGSLKKRLIKYTAVEAVPVRCRFKASWRPGTDTVSIAVPHRCLPYPSAMRVGLHTQVGQQFDWGPTVRRLTRA